MYKSCVKCHDTIPMIDYDIVTGLCVFCLDREHPKLILCRNCKGIKVLTYKISGGNSTYSEKCKLCRGSGTAP